MKFLHVSLFLLFFFSCNTTEKIPSTTDKQLVEKKEFYENGALYRIQHYWKDTILHGLYKSYNENGTVNRYGYFYNGTMYGMWYFFDTASHLLEKIEYANNIENGHDTTFYPNGKIESHGVYINGEEEGPWVFYFQNGRIEHECIYINGFKKTDSKTYDSTGKLLTKQQLN